MIEEYVRRPRVSGDTGQRLSTLTQRELEVLGLVARGQWPKMSETQPERPWASSVRPLLPFWDEAFGFPNDWWFLAMPLCSTRMAALDRFTDSEIAVPSGSSPVRPPSLLPVSA